MQSEPGVSVIVVNHRTAPHLEGLLRALEVGGEPLSVLVVDAASPDRDAAREAVRRSPVPARFLALDANEGFAASVNRGLAATSAPLVLLANPDARPGPGAVHELVSLLEASPGSAAIAPRLTDALGRHQLGDAGEPPSVRGAIEHALAWPRLSGRGGLFCVPGPSLAPRPVGWLSGAFLLVRRDALRAVSGLDASYFLFGEDVVLGERLRAAGFASSWAPSVAVVHEGGASYREDGRLSPLEGRWAAALVRAHGERAGPLARGAFAAALAAGLLGRALAYGVGVGPGGLAAREQRWKGRRLLAAVGAVLLERGAAR
jgi:N-acetylglucosaminyl-diphospho-decaprenol L-rhamnosyltransferase